jgi:hypothetical protein
MNLEKNHYRAPRTFELCKVPKRRELMIASGARDIEEGEFIMTVERLPSHVLVDERKVDAAWKKAFPLIYESERLDRFKKEIGL